MPTHDSSEPVPADELSELRLRHAAEIERLRQRYEREIDHVRSSSQFRIGDAVIGSVRNPRTAASSVAELWRIFRDRRRVAPVQRTPPAAVEPRQPSVRVGAVLDEFSWSCFSHEVELVDLSTDQVGDQVASCSLVFVESAWRGNGGQWSYVINGAGSSRPLDELLQAAEVAGVPAVFWNKEDPVAYDQFIAAARRFPVILTTDADMVGRYQSDAPSASVAALPFAAQPRTHNPIGRPRDPLGRVCFAGAWRGDKYPDRARQMEMLIGPAHDLGVLDIFDRYAAEGDDSQRFPAKFQTSVRGALTYDETMEAYRRYAAFLNVNSVTSSPTMFSRRVFEILACGTPVITTPSRGIHQLLGDVAITVESDTASRDAVERLVADRSYRDRLGHRGYRKVHREHTYGHRMETVLEMAGLGRSGSLWPPVAFVCVTKRPELIDRVVQTFEAQTYPEKRLVLVANTEHVDLERVRARLRHLSDAVLLTEPSAKTLGDCLNAAVAAVDSDYIAKVDDDDDYGPEYLFDMMLTFNYSSAHIVGKRTYFAHLEATDESLLRFPGHEFDYVDEVAGGTLLFQRRLAIEHPFRQLPRGTDTAFLRDARASGHRVFSADRYNFVQKRRAEGRDHTWTIGDDEFRRSSEPVGAGYAVEEFFV